MNATELREWREHYALSRQALADVLGVHYDTVKRWEQGETRIPNMVPLALETLGERRGRLAKQLRSRRTLVAKRKATRDELAAKRMKVAF